AFVPSGSDPTGSSVLAASTEMRTEPCGLIHSPPMKSSSLAIVVWVLIEVPLYSRCDVDIGRRPQPTPPMRPACSRSARQTTSAQGQGEPAQDCQAHLSLKRTRTSSTRAF